MLAACGEDPGKRPTSAPTSTPTVWARAVIEEEGDGNQKTDLFHARGNYRFRWTTALAPGETECSVVVYVRRADGQPLRDDLLLNALIGRPQQGFSGADNVYNLPDTNYYLDVSAGFCSWTVNLTPS
jgi:hypothetical protein